MARAMKLDGRYFTPVEQTTSRQDGWVMVQLEDAGILALVTKGATALDDENAVRQVIVQALRSGKYHHIAAGLLVEDKEKWNPESAEKNAEFFANLTSEEDKAVIRDTFTGILAAFFRKGDASLTRSPTVSATASPSAVPPKQRGRRSTARAAAVGPTAPDGSPTATATA